MTILFQMFLASEETPFEYLTYLFQYRSDHCGVRVPDGDAGSGALHFCHHDKVHNGYHPLPELIRHGIL